MKKIIIAVFAGIVMLSGIACGGSGWSEADKSKFHRESVNDAPSLTDFQIDCMLSYFEGKYDSYSEADNAVDNFSDDEAVHVALILMDKCGLTYSDFSD